jgi:hypothetical protein
MLQIFSQIKSPQVSFGNMVDMVFVIPSIILTAWFCVSPMKILFFHQWTAPTGRQRIHRGRNRAWQPSHHRRRLSSLQSSLSQIQLPLVSTRMRVILKGCLKCWKRDAAKPRVEERAQAGSGTLGLQMPGD